MLTFVASAPLPARRIRNHVSQIRPRASLNPSDADWRAFRARLFRSETHSKPATNAETRNVWAHPVPFIEKGTLLIASPEHFTASHSVAFFANTLVFILEHNNFSTAGLILNRPIARAVPLLPTPSSLYLGGPVGLDTVVVLHRDESLGRPVVGSIRASGFKDVAHRIEDGLLKTEQCRFFCGYSGWSPGQLEEEIRQGVWYTCAASDNVVMEEFEDNAMVKVLRLMGGPFDDIAKLLDDRKKTSK